MRAFSSSRWCIPVMTRRHNDSIEPTVLSTWLQELTYSCDQTLELLLHYVELPLQKLCCSYGRLFSGCLCRRPWLRALRTSTQVLVQSYFISWILYFLLLCFAQIFSNSFERYYFLDTFLSSNRQCLRIHFVHVNPTDSISAHNRLEENFLRENSVLTDEPAHKEKGNYSQLFPLFNLLDDSYFILCQRSLQLHARFHVYSSLLHSNFSHYQFRLDQYPLPFYIDRPPFLDLCLHAFNRSHLNQIVARLLPLASYYYSSVNMFFFDYNFTQVTVTLYELDVNSTHLERVSIHSGWFYELYRQASSVKYQGALSTVLFDGLPAGESSVNYFDALNIPLPADPLLALNEMVQKVALVLPSCWSRFHQRSISDEEHEQFYFAFQWYCLFLSTRILVDNRMRKLFLRDDSIHCCAQFLFRSHRRFDLLIVISMLDFFYILTNGGLVLWCFPSSATEFVKVVNDAIDKTILQVWTIFSLPISRNPRLV